jgi:hypothetical protein
MKLNSALFRFWPVLSAVLVHVQLQAGTWNDHFSAATLESEWTGNRDSFRIVDHELEGESASPLAPSTFDLVEIKTDSTDCSIGVWINVVAPNTHVCTKGAVVARHSGDDGYVFALHEATQTAEIYRLANHQMLLTKPWKIQLGKWYYVRVELHGPSMAFSIDAETVGTITDSVSPSGAVGLAVQDADAVRFDDFTITGPNVAGNVDDLPKPEVSSIEQTSDKVTLRFFASPPYDYFVQVNSTAGPSHDWQTIASVRAKIMGFDAVVTDDTTKGTRFYRIEKVPCYCR